MPCLHIYSILGVKDSVLNLSSYMSKIIYDDFKAVIKLSSMSIGI